jgi:hypothetical protein
VSFPIRAVAENWGKDALLSIEVTVIDERTGVEDTQQTWVRTRPAFPGDSTSVGSVPTASAAVPPPVPGRGPQGSVRFVEPETGQIVPAGRFLVVALGENWGVDTYLFISIEVRNVETGQVSFASCRCNTHPPFPGETAQGGA